MKILIPVYVLCFDLNRQAHENSKNVRSIDGNTKLLLNILAGPQDEKRDWPLYKSLFRKLRPCIL